MRYENEISRGPFAFAFSCRVSWVPRGSFAFAFKEHAASRASRAHTRISVCVSRVRLREREREREREATQDLSRNTQNRADARPVSDALSSVPRASASNAQVSIE